ncbi:S9 family peptidase [Puia dinghuensis]|uniref:Peptidase S9 n=1 Tax=Puia dinghuensis TaxID=1792502 RepID=A0A8J2UCI1_9BACT|nr:S9 family peptidase [Puia dinghuensis]GGA98768.1 peptidase S9 [Puia dinghuensis]
MLNKLAAFAIPLFFFSTAFAQTQYSSLSDALQTGFRLRGKSGPTSVNWIDDGNRYSFIADGEIHTMDPKTLTETTVFTSSGLHIPGSTAPFAYESFQWSRDSKHLVFRTNFRHIFRNSGISDYYIYDVATRGLQQAAKDARSAELSPDGTKVGIERNGNLSFYDFATGKEQQLTNDSTSGTGLFNGHYDWVYEEEFGQGQAWNWSKDSRYIAFWQFDDSRVPVFEMTDFEGIHPPQEKISIPQPGDPNPSVRIGVIDVHSGKKVWLTPDETGDFYIPRIYWTSDPDVLALMTLNRSQNHMKLYFFNVKTGEHHVVLEEQNQTWISIFDFYTDVNDMVYFPEKTREFFWVSDRSGYYHIYHYNYDGKLINQVTKGNWDIIKVTGINPGTKSIYYLSAEASPLEQQLYTIKFDGTGKKKLTEVPGHHTIDMSTNTAWYLDEYSNTTTPTQVGLFNSEGNQLKQLEDNHAVSEFTRTHAYSPLQLFRFKTADGVTLDGSMIKPFNFDSTKKYPVILDIYGGPESHDVFNQFAIGGFQQWLAQNGYIVVDINNRGNADYGSAFMKVVYKQLGKWESNDFVETARYLSSLPYVDGANIAIMGTSYGGYSTTYTLLTHPGVFKAGVANSPVTDWRLYDDIYTERYMGTLTDNAAGYKNSSDMTHAGKLQDHLLIIHSMMDDNVHPAQTMELLTALTNAGKDVDLRIYPPGAHGAAYNWQSYLLMSKVAFEFFEQYLKGSTH